MNMKVYGRFIEVNKTSDDGGVIVAVGKAVSGLHEGQHVTFRRNLTMHDSTFHDARGKLHIHAEDVITADETFVPVSTTKPVETATVTPKLSEEK